MNVLTNQTIRFDCPRTCPAAVASGNQAADVCRFNALLTDLGVVGEVNSNTRTVSVTYKNKQAFENAVKAMNGEILGEGTHQLYEKSETGLGFRLPGWRYPLVLGDGCQLMYDDYHGSWGDVADLERLSGRYRVEAGRVAARQQGWTCRDQKNGDLVVDHPSGGTLTISPTGVDADGFVGSECHEVSELICAEIGTVTGIVDKPEANVQKQPIQRTERE